MSDNLRSLLGAVIARETKLAPSRAFSMISKLEIDGVSAAFTKAVRPNVPAKAVLSILEVLQTNLLLLLKLCFCSKFKAPNGVIVCNGFVFGFVLVL